MVQDMGYHKENVIMAEDGDILELKKDSIKLIGRVEVQNVYVDGLGVGDVGHIVLRDRKVMSEEGVVVVVVPLDQHEGRIRGEIDLISRGFVFEEFATELLDEGTEVLKAALEKHPHKISDWRFLRKMIEETLERFFYEQTERRPLILPVVVEV